jgi:hypothetical protein
VQESPRRASVYAPTPDTAQSVSDVLDSLEDWRQLAACADAPDANIFFYEPFSRDRNNAASGSPVLLEALLYCASCPVRASCLRESFVTWKVSVRSETPNTITSEGIWGGSTRAERDAVSHLPVDERIQVLETGLRERLPERIAAFQRNHPSDGRHRHCSGKTTRSGLRKCHRARELLDAYRIYVRVPSQKPR